MTSSDLKTQSNRPTVSVVMVVCNVDRFLAEAIESILQQTYRDFEFVIVDFGSTDKSKEIVAAYAAKDSRIKLHEIPHCGLGAARNAGCLLAHGKYIALMDADDVSVPERLMWQVEFIETHPQIGMVGGNVELMDANGASLAESVLLSGVILDRPVGDAELKSALLTFCPFWQDAVLMRREAFAMVGGYRAVFNQSEDYDLWARISEHFEVANLKEVVFKYRMHPHQMSVRRRKQQTLCSMSVRASAAARRSGNPDPMDSAKEITPELLIGLGISEAEQEFALMVESKGWIQFMCAAGEWQAAANAAGEMLNSSDWKTLEKRARADMCLDVAELYWKNKQFLKSFLTVVRAAKIRPKLILRPPRLLLERLMSTRVATGRQL
jgi:hypothetical protein